MAEPHYYKILVRRGTDLERIQTVFESGEPVFTTDTKQLYIGDGSTLGGIPVDTSVDLSSYITTITPQDLPGWDEAEIGSNYVKVSSTEGEWQSAADKVVISASFNADGDVYFVPAEDMDVIIATEAGTGMLLNYVSSDGGVNFTPFTLNNISPSHLSTNQVLKLVCSGTLSFKAVTVERV